MSGTKRPAKRAGRGRGARPGRAAATRTGPFDNPDRRSWALACALLLLAALGVAVFAVQGGRTAATSFRYAAGLTGRPGALTVERCWGDDSAKPGLITSCAGTFRPDDGRTPVRDAALAGRHDIGAVLPVRYGGGACHPEGFGDASGDLAGLLAALPAGPLGLWLLGMAVGAGFGDAPAGRRIRAGLLPRNNRAVRYGLWAALGCAVAAGGCLLVGVAGWVASL
ncbi:hypothetical protein ACFW1A_34265 [Kitasatospora sp. NPDC058965]|uniref:hypothetical protein n=1 Tax=Kitasatospora sp. NPDC058965 TaxID=3346682 RepID=UPI0036B9D727